MSKKVKFIPLSKVKSDLFKNPSFRREYEELEPEFQIARQIIGMRIKKKISQEELAEKAGTGQAVISRLEGMNARPSISLLKKIADALQTPIKVTINPS